MQIFTSLSSQNDTISKESPSSINEEDEKSFGIILVSQGSLATSLYEGIEHMLGAQQSIVALPLGCDDSLEMATLQVKKAIDSISDINGIIILADIFGGTPCNAAMSFYKKGKVEVIAGVNLPFVIKLAKMRTRASLEQALEAAHNAGHRYLISCGDQVGYTLSS